MDERRHNMDGALFVDDERMDKAHDERPHAERRVDDEKADDACRVTQNILDRMDLDARVSIREDDERVVLDIDGPDAGRAIGKKGMTLEALQFLVNKIVNRDPDERRHIVLDSGDYRDRHDSGLVAMAKREAKRAVSSGRAVTLEPMSARDRRVIHVSLAKFPGVSTRSEGEGADRRLQIIPARGGAGRERDERARERGHDDRPRERGDDRPRERDSDDRPRERSADDRPRERSQASGGGRDTRPRAPGRERDASDRPQRREAEPATAMRERDVDAHERGYAREQPPAERGYAREQPPAERGYAREPERDGDYERGRDYAERDRD